MAKNDIAGKYSLALRENEVTLKSFSRKVTPDGGKLITNFTTQYYAPSQGVNGEVTWRMEDGYEHTVKLSNWTPAQNAKGENIRSLAPRVRSDLANWSHGEVSAKRMFWNLASFMAGKVAVGTLPSPTRYSGESTLRAYTLRAYENEHGIAIAKVSLHGDSGVEMTLSGDGFAGILRVFTEWGDSILESWGDTKGKRASAIDDSEVGYL